MERNGRIKTNEGGASQLGEHNGSELNQQSTLMLMLPCLFKLIIKDRAPPLRMPEERRICLRSASLRKLMMNYSVYQVALINEPADGPISIPEDVFFGFSAG